MEVDEVVCTTPFVSGDHDYPTQSLTSDEKLQGALEEINILQEKVTTLTCYTFCVQRFSNDSNLINFIQDLGTITSLKVCLCH